MASLINSHALITRPTVASRPRLLDLQLSLELYPPFDLAPHTFTCTHLQSKICSTTRF